MGSNVGRTSFVPVVDDVIVEACFETVVRESAEGEFIFAAWAVGSDGVVELCETREVLFGEIETE